MPVIRLVDSDIAFDCAADDTVARAALRVGLGMPYECNVGCCGTCKIELVEGEIDSAWPAAPALSERDKSRNRVLGCQAQARGDCTIKVRLDDQYVPRHRPQRFLARLRALRDVTHDIREFHFEADQPRPFLCGQYALLALPGVPGQRAYSMSNAVNGNADTATGWHFQIKRVPGGQGTGVLFDQLQIGAGIALDGPYGGAYLRDDRPRDVICIAGGSGISPLLSIARGMMHSAAMADRTLHFFYGGRARRDLCGQAELAALPGFGTRLQYHPVLSMPEPGEAWHGLSGFVHEQVLPTLSTLGGMAADYEYYFAGPPVMTQATQRLLMQNKVPLSQMHFDQFY